MALSKAIELYAAISRSATKRRSFDSVIYNYCKLTGVYSDGEHTIHQYSFPLLPIFADHKGFIHRGVFNSLLDFSTSLVVWSVDPKERMTVSADMFFTYIHTLEPGGSIDIMAIAERCEEKLAFTRGEIRKGQDIVCHCRQTLFFLDKKQREMLDFGETQTR